MNKRYVWYTDTHLNFSFPGTLRLFISNINRYRPDGVFLTGDISNGWHIERTLDYMAENVECDVYYVLGNHDYYGRTFASVHDDLNRLSRKHSNLRWMTTSGVVSLSARAALVGTEGWYDARLGDSAWLKYTFDWFRTYDFLWLRSMQARLEAFRELAGRSADLIENLLEKAFESHDVAYVLTHFPPWPEAVRGFGTMFEKFWLPYNTNYTLGKRIEHVMSSKKDKKVIVLAGHTHTEFDLTVSENIQCRVSAAKYYGIPDNKKCIVI